MAQQIINNGTFDNDPSAEKIRTAFDKVNDNFTEVYASDLQTVTDNGNVTDNPIILDSGTTETNIFTNKSISLNNVNKDTFIEASRVEVTKGDDIISLDTNLGAKLTLGSVNGEVNTRVTNITNDYDVEFPDKPVGVETLAMASDLVNLPTDDQKAAMDNASLPSAGNPFITQNQIIGGLPTGEIPTGRAAKTTGTEVTSATFTDVPGLSTTVNLLSAVHIYGIVTFEMKVSGGGSDPVGEVQLIVNGETSRVVVVDFDGGKSNEVGSINYRTLLPAPIGVNTVKIQARKVSGTKTLTFDNGHLFAQAQQAPKGDIGFGVAAGGNTGEALVKATGNDYDTEWKQLIGNEASTPQVKKSIWSGTLAQYNAIPVKSNDVIYFIE